MYLRSIDFKSGLLLAESSADATNDVLAAWEADKLEKANVLRKLCRLDDFHLLASLFDYLDLQLRAAARPRLLQDSPRRVRHVQHPCNIEALRRAKHVEVHALLIAFLHAEHMAGGEGLLELLALLHLHAVGVPRVKPPKSIAAVCIRPRLLVALWRRFLSVAAALFCPFRAAPPPACSLAVAIARADGLEHDVGLWVAIEGGHRAEYRIRHACRGEGVRHRAALADFDRRGLWLKLILL
mmetsp:Transcript_1177/g.1665  ORF Transcript_1177/g.1665 Transcript_1177/m.1665 type:complete len:240 (-) Transcript_1177:30-749(-)